MARPTIEFLIPPKLSPTGEPMLRALHKTAAKAGHRCEIRERYRGECDWLVLFGVGAPDRAAAREKHVASGRRALLWDLGYFERAKIHGHLRVSVDHDHPQAWLDRTAPDPERWQRLRLELREEARPDGPILLVGLGHKSRDYLGPAARRWEEHTLKRLRDRFPRRRIIYRPKPRHRHPTLACDTDGETPFETLLKGASLVVCRHSNCAIDAALAGVPFECEDGAAKWLAEKPFTQQNRLDFLQRLAWWQWKNTEAAEAWQFLTRTLG